MSRTAVVPLSLVATGIAPGAGTTIDSALVTAGVSIACGGITNRVILRVTNSAATPRNVIVRAGDPYYAHRAKLGDLVVAVTQSGGERLVSGLEAARVVQVDGVLWVDFETGFTGTLRVEQVPWPAP